jgi:hypothetical protein
VEKSTTSSLGEGAGQRDSGQSAAPTGGWRLTGLHQHHREHEQRHSPFVPECEALAIREDGMFWTAMSMLEAKKGFRRLKPYKHLPVLKATCQNHRNGQTVTPAVNRLVDAAYC